MVQQIRSLATLAQDPDLIPSTHTVASITPVSEDWILSSGFLHRHQAHMWYIGIHASKTLILKKMVNKKHFKVSLDIYSALPLAAFVPWFITFSVFTYHTQRFHILCASAQWTQCKRNETLPLIAFLWALCSCLCSSQHWFITKLAQKSGSHL